MTSDVRTEIKDTPHMTTQDMVKAGVPEGTRPWMGECLVTDGATPPTKAVKVSVMYPAEPNATVRQQLLAQTVGQYRVHYGEWPSTESKSVTVREL